MCFIIAIPRDNLIITIVTGNNAYNFEMNSFRDEFVGKTNDLKFAKKEVTTCRRVVLLIHFRCSQIFYFVYFRSGERVNIYNGISLDFLKVSSLNEDLQKRRKQLALANHKDYFVVCQCELLSSFL